MSDLFSFVEEASALALCDDNPETVILVIQGSAEFAIKQGREPYSRLDQASIIECAAHTGFRLGERLRLTADPASALAKVIALTRNHVEAVNTSCSLFVSEFESSRPS